MSCLMLNDDGLLAQPEAADVGPLSMTVTLAGSPTVSLGEPILLRYVVKDSSDQPASVFTADVQHNPLITERFTDASGKPLVPSVSPIPSHKSAHTMVSWDGLSINGSTSATWEAVANAGITFPRPGSYVLRVHVQNPYVIGDVDQGAHYVLSGDYVFPLEVVKAKDSYLHSTAERLRRSILQTLDVKVKRTLIKALFSMPEATASASWQALVEDPKFDDGYALGQVATALARVHTIKAADILSEMVWSPAQPSSALDEASPAQHLYEMYDTGDPALRKHIEELHKQHGAAMSPYRIE